MRSHNHGHAYVMCVRRWTPLMAEQAPGLVTVLPNGVRVATKDPYARNYECVYIHTFISLCDYMRYTYTSIPMYSSILYFG